ncbi:conserved hypothetical protein [Ricinus communis]|uniref:Uncharacterized protein n=1 Tax=Ricinus communis TaxID=3988 RepID=B9RKW0_RICCO|nr:conserved hypothetical protein [Ricinus communis]
MATKELVVCLELVDADEKDVATIDVEVALAIGAAHGNAARGVDGGNKRGGTTGGLSSLSTVEA